MDLTQILINQYKEEQEAANINPVFCTKDLGEALYKDKLDAIGQYETVSLILKKYINNNDVSKEVISDLEKEYKDGKIVELKKVEKFGYNEDYLNILNSLEMQPENEFYLTNGLTEKGYVELTDNYSISIDLKVKYGISILLNDTINKILVKNNKPFKILSYIEANFVNSIEFDKYENILQIGADLGYIGFLANKKIDIYEEDDTLANYLNDKVYRYTNPNTNLIKVDEIDINKYDLIIISPSVDEEYQMKLFYDLKLYNVWDKVESSKKQLVLTKFKSDFQDVVMTDREQVEDSLIEAMKEMKGIGQVVLSSQMDFVERAENYLKTNNLYFDSYKKWQRFIRNDKNIIEILKSGD